MWSNILKQESLKASLCSGGSWALHLTFTWFTKDEFAVSAFVSSRVMLCPLAITAASMTVAPKENRKKRKVSSCIWRNVTEMSIMSSRKDGYVGYRTTATLRFYAHVGYMEPLDMQITADPPLSTSRGDSAVSDSGSVSWVFNISDNNRPTHVLAERKKIHVSDPSDRERFRMSDIANRLYNISIALIPLLSLVWEHIPPCLYST